MLFCDRKEIFGNIYRLIFFNIICLDKFNLINNVIFLLYFTNFILLLKTFQKILFTDINDVISNLQLTLLPIN